MSMCGRISIQSNPRDLAEFFGAVIPETIDWKPDHNVPPQSYVPVLRHDGEKVVKDFFWWLVPGWAKDFELVTKGDGRPYPKFAKPPLSMFNTRKETLENPQKAYWQRLLKARRCCILVDGFYEWPAKEKGTGKRSPHYYTLADGLPMALAGLYDEVKRPEGDPFYSCTIITTEPNDLIKALPHHRMPVILGREDVEAWLDPGRTSVEELVGLLRVFPASRMKGREVKL